MTLMRWIRNNLGLFRRVIVLRGVTKEMWTEEGLDKMCKELDEEGYDVIVVPEGVDVEVR